MKILVIGGMGVIGGAITEAAVRTGADVTVIGRRAASGKWKELNVSFLQGDWFDDAFASGSVEQGFDVIVDTLIFDEKDMQRSARIVNDHCKQLIYISTDSVYAHPNKDLSEDKEIALSDIEWKYGINKRKAELFLASHSEDYSFRWTVIRPTITFGDTRIPVGFSSRRGTYTLIDRIEKGKPVIRFDDNTRHAVCHSSVFGNAALSLFLNEKAYGRFYHISDDISYTFDEIFSVIKSIIGKEPVFFHADASILKKYNEDAYEDMIYDKNPEFTLDNSSIKSVCPGVSFHSDLKEVLNKTIDNLREHRNENGEDKDYDLLSDLIILKSDPASEYISGLSDERIAEIKKYASKAHSRNTSNKIKNTLRSIRRKLR
ncbi:MAG: NAD-dependent epimerase/dehydratase family protein [Saccharofermentans sp.]|nr:NAD-dependent epimerase/dehydratase family protein [Saccharofermentans sp.]